MNESRHFFKWAGESILASGLLVSPLGSFRKQAKGDGEYRRVQ